MAKERKYMSVDGNEAAAYSSYAFTEVAGIYPITPSSPMADHVDQWSLRGRKNIFGQNVEVVEMQSEGGAAGAVHGSLNAGALTTTYTASQGLLLKIPNMYKIAGELLPSVIHVSARAVATNALSIFGDHSDVMAARQTGYALLASSSVQEAGDLAAVSHLATIKGRIPFLHFFDGFRTSHEIQKIEVLDYEDLKELVDQDGIDAFRERSLSPSHGTMRGTAQQPEIFFQGREASNRYYDALPEIVQEYMDEITKLTGREYKLFNYYGAADAEEVIVAMGSVCETIGEVVDYMNANGRKVGLINVHLYRPFSIEHFVDQIPASVRKISVLDRTKEPGSIGEPLYLDVVSALRESGRDDIKVVGGRYGLGSKDTAPEHILSVFNNLDGEMKNHFTIGITDDVTHLSLPAAEALDVADPSTVACRFWGLGSDGTVGANKNSIKIIGDHTNKYTQAYFSYDSKKSGGITISDLRFGDKPIRSPYLVSHADFVSCSQQSYIGKYNMLESLKPGGTFLLNAIWSDEEIGDNLPASMKRFMAMNDIQFYVVDAVNETLKIGLGNRTNTILQAAFFKLANIIPIDEAVKYMKDAILKTYGSKGDDIVKMNYKAVDAGIEKVRKVSVPAEWANAEDEEEKIRIATDFVKNFADPFNAQEGNRLPVSAMMPHVDGTFPAGTSKYEKRGIATHIPRWIPENCIQCNQCAYVCPHSVIRPFLLDEEQTANTPEGAETLKGMRPYTDYDFRIQVSALDCTGCASCVETCPSKEKALVLEPIETQLHEADNWEHFISLKRPENPMGTRTVKGSQFELPYLEFHGACAGCGETPYANLVTQLFGPRMQISNATGCSSIWGGSAPSQVYTTDENGRGPAWVNSLFEDNAENGLGLHLGAKQIRKRLTCQLSELRDGADGELAESIDKYLTEGDEKNKTLDVSNELIEVLEANKEGDKADLVRLILKNKDYLTKRSTWIFGGDGWAYDIGYGGLDHVLASGEDVNVLVFDTEVYSNTGGQASKATPTGAIAEFAAGGKPVKKKDLGMNAMSYGYVYVAQIAMGANQTQTLKAIAEAEAYDGPSLIIAYSPCINHGIKGGLRYSQGREKDAVACGYWHLYRHDPRLAEEGKNPFQLDSRPPKADFSEFLKREVRFNSLAKKYPAEKVEEIFALAEKHAMERYGSYVRKSKEWETEEAEA